MGYYTGGDYYRAGDYYAAGGFFDVVKGIVGTVGKIAKGTGLPVVSQVGGVVSGLTGQRQTFPAPPPPPGGFSGFQLGPLRIGSQRGGQAAEVTENGEVVLKPKRRRMNYGNVKALRRADRRMTGFVKVARSALKHTNYKVVSKSAGSRTGSRGVITRREASRALSR